MALPGHTAVSAPGKVLLAGGYLVLDREYTALVFALDARIHVDVAPLHTTSGVSLSEIIVRSPQFTHAEWRYGHRLPGHGQGYEITQLSASTSNRNPFVETALSYALSYISTRFEQRIEPAVITILADNDYYSQPDSETKSSTKPPKFANFNVPLHEAHKTGLGSSAALVTAFTGAILTHYLPRSAFDLSTAQDKARLHNLAQAAHCAAQGKVGSGFDVAAATYGSCLYKRFSPSILEALGSSTSEAFLERLKAVVEETGTTVWDTEILKNAVAIPPGMRLVMCDVDCGSGTVGMVKKVLAWRRDNPEEALNLWTKLKTKNEELRSALLKASEYQSNSKQEYEAALSTIAITKGEKILNRDLKDLVGAILDIRSLIREMSKAAGVPIEPEAQTNLLDACSQLPGVLGGVVPGAGGYDAIVLLVVDDQTVLEELGKFLEGFHDGSTPQEGQIGRVGVLGVREEMDGVTVEQEATYGDWVRQIVAS